MGSRWRTGRRTESNNAGACLRRGGARLGPCAAGQRRQRGSASSNVQKLPAGKFQGLPRPLLKFSGGSGDILRDVLH
jgi:hypothetical protein